MPLWASAEFEVPALTRRFENVAPPSVENPAQYRASSFGRPSVSPAPPVPRSARESYHDATRFPVVGSSEIFGRNWLFDPTSWFTRTGELHVAPSSSEWRTYTSVSSLSFLF